MKVNAELIIQNKGKLYEPITLEGITFQTEREKQPGKLTFSVLKDAGLSFGEGNPVRLKVNGQNVFYGFVFKKHRKNDKIIDVTCYDQLRYLKAKDTYVYTNKSANEVIQMIAGDFRLKTGAMENTGYKIATRVEENEELFQIIQNALDMTLQNTKKMFVLYDDFGKITLKNLANMKVNLLIDEETGQNFDYTSSIDNNTYNKVKLTYDNEETGKREVFIAQDSNNMNKWGVLQYYDTIKKGENGKAKADALLKLYNAKTRNLTIENAFGDVRIRAGSMVVVMLNLGDIKTKNWMVVEKCKHVFKQDEHFMTLNLRGGEFNA